MLRHNYVCSTDLQQISYGRCMIWHHTQLRLWELRLNLRVDLMAHPLCLSWASRPQNAEGLLRQVPKPRNQNSMPTPSPRQDPCGTCAQVDPWCEQVQMAH
mmetsp:Transcript_7760/g.17913  ORF Transcript_7760/g.17913 Transcript_7760/m.17913 type:complete len:101 (+) Transcript_7760:1884-2186(+)